MDIEKINTLTNEEWLKIGVKSILPALISLKAYLDDTISKSSESTEHSETTSEKIEME